MWILTKHGFYSVVQKPWDVQGDTLTVRARVAADLEALRAVCSGLGAVTEDDAADYRYRAQAPRLEVGAALERLALQIDYNNFKNEIAHAQGYERAAVYHGVWHELLQLQRGKA